VSTGGYLTDVSEERSAFIFIVKKSPFAMSDPEDRGNILIRNLGNGVTSRKT